MGLTLDQLFEAYTDEDQDFATDVYEWFGSGMAGIGAKAFSDKYTTYLPTYDPTAEKLAFQDKYLSFRNAAEVHNLSKEATDQVYSQEMESISGALKSELAQGRGAAGQLGLRSGTLESAIESTLATSAGKADDLGNRLLLQKDKDLSDYNIKMVDSTLDYDKDILDTKQDFYDRVMDSVMRLSEKDAFDVTGGCKWPEEIWDDILQACRPAEDYEVNLQMGDVDPDETMDEHLGDVVEEAFQDANCVAMFTILCFGNQACINRNC